MKTKSSYSKIQITKLLDWLTLHMQDQKSLTINYELLLLNRTNNTTEASDFIYKRIDNLQERINALPFFNILKVTVIISWLIFINSIILFKLTEFSIEVNYIFIIIAFISLVINLLISPFILFNKSRAFRNLSEHQKDLNERLKILNENNNLSTTSSKTEKFKIEIKNIESDTQPNQTIRLQKATDMGILFYLLFWKKLTSIKTATEFRDIFQDVFCKKNGSQYYPRSINNCCKITSENEEVWKAYDNFIELILKHKSDNNLEYSKLDAKTLKYVDILTSKIKSHSIEYNIEEEQLNVLLKIFCHNIISKNTTNAMLNENEYQHLYAVQDKILNRSKEEKKYRPKL